MDITLLKMDHQVSSQNISTFSLDYVYMLLRYILNFEKMPPREF